MKGTAGMTRLTVGVGSDIALRDFLLTLRQKSAHGSLFEYRSCETDVLGWICEVAGGQRALCAQSRRSRR